DEGVAIGDLDADLDFDPNPQYESKVEAHLHDLIYQERKLDALVFRLDGRSSNYAVRLDARALGMSLAALAGGPFTNGVWQGQLRSVDVVGTESLRLKLQRPVGLQVSADRVRAEWLCLVGQPGSVCADGEWTPKQWNLTLNADRMPLATFTA